ncbi:kinetochore protein Spc25 [Syngnathoides biaculeatus]|uniref:kinetochore protein Spc25 n=1 Tax=Syngnathoides biaculeatus TaxID=300417 RepID=UPI002ADDA718|nr:kinetochore protein Spc25 [Syngnathoides biaculeatus]
MTSIADSNIAVIFEERRTEKHSRVLKAFAEHKDVIAELSHCYKQFIKLSREGGLKKSVDDEILFETAERFKKDLQHMNAISQEKKRTISEIKSNPAHQEKQTILQEIECFKKEQAQRREIIESQYKANKDRLKNLKKARVIFQEYLGLEIRKIHDEKLQFVFRCINKTDLDRPYVITMGLKNDRSYQIMSSLPPLECLPDLERRLQETNNLAVFLKNVRLQFIAQA